MSYGEIIGTAFRIAWRNRYLWFFGLFAGTGANVPGPNLGGNFNFGRPQRAHAAEPLSPLAQGPPHLGLIVAIGVAVLVLVLVLIVLSLISQGALAESVAAIDRGGERRFGTAWRAGTRHFWRVLGLAALLLAIVLAAVIVVGVPLAALVWGVFSLTGALAPRILVGVFAGVVAIVALVLLFIPLPIIGQLGLRELVLREQRPVAAFRAGLALFRGELGKSLLLWLIQLGISIGLAIAVFIAVIVVGLVLALPGIGLIAGGLKTAAIVAWIIGGAILLALLLVVLGALGTFHHAYWTIAYLRLRASGAAVAPAAA